MIASAAISLRSIPDLSRRLAASLLCLALAADPALGATARRTAAPPQPKQIQGTDRVLHALDRLTFGPRPGELAAVQTMGLSQWFERQLQPETIDDSALEARLARFPAMELPQERLLQAYPSPQMLRQMIATGAPLPSDPLEHAIYADQIAFYEAAKARKEAAQPEMGAGVAQPGVTSPVATVPARNGEGLPSQQQQIRRPNLLDGTSSAYEMSGRKTGPGTPAAAGMAQEGTGQGEELLGPDGRGKGKPQHAEGIFPEAQAARILGLAPDARVRQILSMPPDDLIRFRRSLSQDEVTALAAGLSPRQMEIFASLQGSARMIGAEVLQTRLERDVYSERQLQAVMTDFWLNHFNVYLRKNQNEPYLLPAYERETIRPLALGRFEDLLVATARSPAMLEYLDNWQSIGPDSVAALRAGRNAQNANNPQGKQAQRDRGLNENYARELMELHTLGVGCEVSQDHTAAELDKACGTGYTQADVTEVAKVFSGWTIEGPNRGGLYRFEERRHEPGAKTVLGHRISEAGEEEGREVLHLLATSPATAKFLSTKLAIRFVSDTPPPSLVATMTKAFLASGGDIKAVLRAMFQSPEFWSPTVVRAKVKTPLEFVASALRASDADISNGVPLVQALDRLGMPIYGMQTPNGYSWTADPWVSTGALVTRMNFALGLSGNRIQGTRIDWGQLSGATSPAVKTADVSTPPAPDNGAEEARLELLLMGRPVSDRTRAAVLAQAGNAGGTVPASAQVQRDISLKPVAGEAAMASAPAAGGQQSSQAALMAGLLLGSPEFQRR